MASDDDMFTPKRHLSALGQHFGLYNILPLPILYGAWQAQGGFGWGSYIARVNPNHSSLYATASCCESSSL